MLTYPPLLMSSDGAVQNAPSLIYESSHTSPSQHTWTPSSSSYIRDQRNGNREIWKSLMMTFPNICLSFDVDDQLSSTILLSCFESISIESLVLTSLSKCPHPQYQPRQVLPHTLLNQVLFSQAAHFQVLQRQALREDENWGKLCPSLIFSLLNLY